MAEAVAKEVEVKQEVTYPRWVEVHESHIVRSGKAPGEGFDIHVDGEGKVSLASVAGQNVRAGGYDTHVDRSTGKVTVLVNSKEEEDIAVAAKTEANPVAEKPLL